MVSVFFAAFAFFGAIVFLPRWFQVVEGFSPTNSGLAALPLMIGLIGSSIVSGLIVSRTGHYKWLIVGSVAVMGFAVFLMTNLTVDTPVPLVWLWMFIAGLGVGPTFSVPTIVIQNAVPFRQLGVATSNLTFFRQIGGTIALAFVGTIFASTFQEQLPTQFLAAGVPPSVLAGLRSGGSRGKIDANVLTGVGDVGASDHCGRGFSRTGHRSGPRWHPRGIQLGHGPDVLARRGRSHRRGRRGRRDQGDPAADLQRAARLRRGSGRRVGGHRSGSSRVHLGRVGIQAGTVDRLTLRSSMNRPGRPRRPGRSMSRAIAGIPSAA